MTTPTRPLSEIARNLRFNADNPWVGYEGMSLIACDRLREAADALDRAEERVKELERSLSILIANEQDDGERITDDDVDGEDGDVVLP